MALDKLHFTDSYQKIIYELFPSSPRTRGEDVKPKFVEKEEKLLAFSLSDDLLFGRVSAIHRAGPPDLVDNLEPKFAASVSFQIPEFSALIWTHDVSRDWVVFRKGMDPVFGSYTPVWGDEPKPWNYDDENRRPYFSRYHRELLLALNRHLSASLARIKDGKYPLRLD